MTYQYDKISSKLIAQLLGKHISFLWLFALSACQWQGDLDLSQAKNVKLKTPLGKELMVEAVYSNQEQTRGLSGRPSSSFTDQQAMLFFYPQDDMKSFWMPDTYFDLDIFFLSEDLKVLEIERNVPHHPGHDESQIPIARTPSIFCRHVLEMRSDSPIAKSIRKGDQLIWISSPSLEQIQSNIHLLQ